ncbi:MAG: hypothetical protein RR297_01545 [Clostridia bacterium]
MLISEYMDLRNEVNHQLLDYRRNRDRLQRGYNLTESERAAMQQWCDAIARAYTYLKRRNPEKARAMIRLFGLHHPVPRYKKTKQRVVHLMNDLNVSESTLYRWRGEIIQLVLLAAVENRTFSLFDLQGHLSFPDSPEETDTTIRR